MQKLVKRSLAWILSLMMVVTMCSGAISVLAETAEPFTEQTETVNGLLHLGVTTATSADGNWGNYRYFAQEFVPSGDVISGVQLGLLLTGGAAKMHIEIRKGDANSEAIYTTEVPFNSKGNLCAMYEFGFDRDVAVTAGEVYYLVYYLAGRDDGNVCLACGKDTGSAGGAAHPLYAWQMAAGGDVTFDAGVANLVAAFKVIETKGMNKQVLHLDTFHGITCHTGSFSGKGIDASVKTEGEGSLMTWWNGGNAVEVGATSKTNMSLAIQYGGISFQNAKYFVFDVYCKDFDIDVVSGIRFGYATAWHSVNHEVKETSEGGVAYINAMKNLSEGWNTIVVDLGDTSGWTENIQNIWFAFDDDAAVRFTGTNPVMAFDNIRIMDEAGYQAWKNPVVNPPAAPTIDGVKDDLYTSDKMITLTTAYTGQEGSETNNTLNTKVSTYYTWDNDYNYVFVEITGSYAYSPAGLDLVYFKNNTNLKAGVYMFSAEGGGYVQYGLLDAAGYKAPTTAGSNIVVTDIKNTFDQAAGVPRTYEFKFPRDAAADGFVVSPVIVNGPSGTLASQEVIAYDAAYNTNGGKVVKYDDPSTWTDTSYVDVQFRAMDKANDLNIAHITMNGVNTDNYLEGTGSMQYTTTAESTSSDIHFFIYSLGQAGNPIDISGATHLAFDIWVPEANMFNNIAGDAGVSLDSTDHMNQWGADGGASADAVKTAMRGLKAGWNHVAIPLSETSAVTNLGDMRIYMVNTGIAADKTILIDDVRFVNEAALNDIVPKRNAAKDVTAAIKSLPAVDALKLTDKEAVEAVAAAYAAVDDAYKSLVIGADAITAAQNKIAELEAAGSKNIVEVQAKSCDGANSTGTYTGVSVDSANFTEGTGSTSFDISGNDKMKPIIYGNNAGGGTNDDRRTTDISSVIDANGDFYYTFDFYISDPAIITKNRFVVQLGCYTDANTQIGADKGALTAQVKADGKGNATWADFGLPDGPVAGWNHVAIKMNTAADNKYAEAKRPMATYWDAKNVWMFQFYADNFTAGDGACFKVDDIRFMSVDAYEANFASNNAVKDVIIAINEITGVEDTDGINAAQNAYDALSAEQQAKVTNYSRLEKFLSSEVVDVQLHAMDTVDMQIIAGGNNKAPYGVQGTIIHDNYVEGTGAHFSYWGADPDLESPESLYMSLTSLPDVDLSKATYLAFDIYVHGFSVNYVGVAGTDCRLRFGSKNEWGSGDLYEVSANTVNSYCKTWTEGWNHVLIPISSSATGVKNLWFFFEKAVTLTASDAYVLFDDFRLLNDNALAADADRTAAKAVIAAIAGLKGDDAEGIAAAQQAYSALTEAQQAYVTNYSRLEELAAAPAAAQAVIDAIDALDGDYVETIFNSCDVFKVAVEGGELEVVANLNSGAIDMAITEEGYAKYSLKAEGAPDFPMCFRNTAGVVASEYDNLVLDLYVSEGMRIVTGSWGNIHYQTANGGLDDNKVDSVSLASVFETLVPGQWNTVKLPVTAASDRIFQITLRPYGIFSGAAGEYVMVDNVRFCSGTQKTLTYADNAAVDAVKAQYDELSASAKALVTNYATLEGYLAAMDQEEAAAAAVVAAISALPAVDELTIDSDAAVQAARKAYDALAADTKPLVTNLATLEAAEARMIEIKENLSEDELAAAVDTAIDGLPAADDVVVTDENAIQIVVNMYNELSDSAKEKVTKKATLDAIVDALDQAKADKASADAVVALIAALPSPATAGDVEAVDAARNAYNALSDKAKNYVTNYAVLEAAEKAVADDIQAIADADAVKAAIAKLPSEVNADNADAVAAVKKAYDDLSDAAKGYVTEEEKAALDAAYAAAAMLVPTDVQFRAFDYASGDFAASDSGSNQAGLNSEMQIEGTACMATTWPNGNGGDSQKQIMQYIYAFKQNNVDATNADGNTELPIINVDSVYLTFDLYVSDAQAILNLTGDAGVGIDTMELGGPNQWGNTAVAKKGTVVNALKDAGLHDGWNHIAIRLTEWKKPVDGRVLKVCSLRFFVIGVELPEGFTMAIDDIRFMNGEALETIFPARSAAKEVTVDLRGFTAENTYEDFKTIYFDYMALDAQYQDVVIGWDAFVETYSDFAAQAQSDWDAQLNADKEAAKVVDDTISALPAVDSIAPTDEAAIVAARAAYDALTEAQKNLVNNYDALVAAEAALADAKQAAADAEAAAAVDALIEAFPETITPDNAEQVNAAKAAYDALTDTQKALVKEANVNALTAALESIVAPTYTLGDVDNSGKIDAADALIVLKIAVGKYEATDDEKAASNVNKDDKIDAVDALEILKKAVGKEACF